MTRRDFKYRNLSRTYLLQIFFQIISNFWLENSVLVMILWYLILKSILWFDMGYTSLNMLFSWREYLQNNTVIPSGCVQLSSGGILNRGHRTIVDPQGAKCGWNANGTRLCQERYFYCKYYYILNSPKVGMSLCLCFLNKGQSFLCLASFFQKYWKWPLVTWKALKTFKKQKFGKTNLNLVLCQTK